MKVEEIFENFDSIRRDCEVRETNLHFQKIPKRKIKKKDFSFFLSTNFHLDGETNEFNDQLKIRWIRHDRRNLNERKFDMKNENLSSIYV